ncbi:MAG TPA: ankyrin repeat domain-containing protein [Vicinamibacterales bacterium]
MIARSLRVAVALCAAAAVDVGTGGIGQKVLAAGVTPLVAAVKAGGPAALRAVVERRADVNVAEPDGTTPLHWAAHAGDAALVRALLGAGARPNVANRYGMTPVSLAARTGDTETLEALLTGGADLKAADASLRDGQTSLMLAARTGRADTVALLLEAGANADAAEKRTGTTALMWAAVDNQPAVITALIRGGAHVNARSLLTAFPHTPPGVIGDALEEGNSYVGQTVLPRGGWTALMYAARQGSSAAITALADGGADLNVADPDGTTALGFAAINAHAEAAALLLKRGANPNLGDRAGMTPLYAAVDLHTMQFGFGRPNLSPTQVAASVDMVKALLAHGADPNARLSSRILKRVYTGGDGRLGKGATPYMRAARAGDVLLMKTLLAAGADPSLTQENGNSPLLLAAGLGYRGAIGGTEAMALEAITFSLAQGADINAVNTAGDSALHIAATTNFEESGTAAGSLAIVRFLVERGAKLDTRNKQGRTALESVVRAREHSQEIAAFLRSRTSATP